jgi:hypothetical protein
MLCTAGHDPSGLIKTIPMQPGEALGLAAQIAVGLAGFAGVVVVFRRGSLHELSPIDKYRLWLLLANSAVPLLCCLFAILLLTVKPAPISIWRWCSAFSTLLLSPLVYMSRRTTAKLGPNAIRNIGGYRYVYYGMAIVGTGIILYQLVNVAFLNLFWIFFLGIAFQLAAGIVQFVRMILLPPHESEPDGR